MSDFPFPSGWRDWPRDQRLSHLTLTRTREGMIRELLLLADYSRERTSEEQHHVTEEEVAAIYDLVIGIRGSEEGSIRGIQEAQNDE